MTKKLSIFVLALLVITTISTGADTKFRSMQETDTTTDAAATTEPAATTDPATPAQAASCQKVSGYTATDDVCVGLVATECALKVGKCFW